jgi:hypothetical protein
MCPAETMRSAACAEQRSGEAIRISARGSIEQCAMDAA